MQPKTPKDFNASFTNQADSTCVAIKIKTTYIFKKTFTAAYNQTKKEWHLDHKIPWYDNWDQSRVLNSVYLTSPRWGHGYFLVIILTLSNRHVQFYTVIMIID